MGPACPCAHPWLHIAQGHPHKLAQAEARAAELSQPSARQWELPRSRYGSWQASLWSNMLLVSTRHMINLHRQAVRVSTLQNADTQDKQAAGSV